MRRQTIASLVILSLISSMLFTALTNEQNYQSFGKEKDSGKTKDTKLKSKKTSKPKDEPKPKDEDKTKTDEDNTSTSL